MDVRVPAQCSAPGNAAVGGIEQTDLRFLVGINGGNQFGAYLFPGRAAGSEIVLDDPLQIALGAQRGVVVASGGGLDACLQLGRRTWRDAVDHGVGEAHVGIDPGQDVGVTDLLGEVPQATPHPITVVAQVVAVLQRDGAATGLLAGAQQRDEGAVQRLARFAFLHALQVGLQVGEAGVQIAVFQQVVAGFGDGEGDDAGDRIGGQFGDGLQAGIVGNHLVDGRDPVVFHLAVRIDGFQREIAVLGGQGLQQRVGVGTDVGAGQLPAGLALILQALQVDHLVGAVEVAEPQVQDAADDGSGGGCGHDAAPRSRRWNLGQQRVRQRDASRHFNHMTRMERPIPEPPSRPISALQAAPGALEFHPDLELVVGKAQLLQMVLDVLGVDVVRGGAPAGLLAGLAAGLLGVDGKPLGQQRGLQQQVAVALMSGAVDGGAQVDERGVHDQSAFQKSANTWTDRK